MNYIYFSQIAQMLLVAKQKGKDHHVLRRFFFDIAKTENGKNWQKLPPVSKHMILAHYLLNNYKQTTLESFFG